MDDLVHHAVGQVAVRRPSTGRNRAEATDTRPRANTCRPGPITSTTSPDSNSPSTRRTPAGSRLFGRSTSARRAPASTWSEPATSAAKAIQSLRADSVRSCADERRADQCLRRSLDQHVRPGRAGDHATDARPRRDPRCHQLARHPAAAPATPLVGGRDREQRVVDTDEGNELGRRSRSGGRRCRRRPCRSAGRARRLARCVPAAPRAGRCRRSGARRWRSRRSR